MSLYSDYDYLCNEPYLLDGIGNIKCPTLRDIRKITYHLFSIFVNILSMDISDYLAIDEIKEKYLSIPEEERENLSYFEILAIFDPYVIYSMLCFFLTDEIEINKENIQFDVYNCDRKKIGEINKNNFESLKRFLRDILGIINTEEKPQKFKNDRAKKMYEKMQLHKKNEDIKKDENFTLDNMIKKYCTHNKVGINILNVWDMTYYQFRVMFNEYSNGRQCDYADMIAANTFSYSKSSDYKPMAYLNKI